MLPQMSARWRNTAIAFAVLGFISIIAVQGSLTTAVLNAAIWFGIVYLVFIVVYGLRRVFGKSGNH